MEYPYRWIIQQAGGSTGIVICSLERDEIECMVHFNFPITNNEAKYEA